MPALMALVTAFQVIVEREDNPQNGKSQFGEWLGSGSVIDGGVDCEKFWWRYVSPDHLSQLW